MIWMMLTDLERILMRKMTVDDDGVCMSQEWVAPDFLWTVRREW